METIVICGKSNGDPLLKSLLPTLKHYGKVLYIDGKQLQNSLMGSPDFFVCEQEAMPELQLERGILVLRSGARLRREAVIPSGVRCILTSKERRLAEALGEQRVSAISCGMGIGDTLGIASLDYNTSVLSLQRSITTLQGEILEPHDFQVKTTGNAGPCQLLTVSMILLLLGLDSGKSFRILE